MVKIKDRLAFVFLFLATGGVVAGGWMLANAYRADPRGEPPAMAFVAIGLGVLVLLIASSHSYQEPGS
jgi:hypothetical protein